MLPLVVTISFAHFLEGAQLNFRAMAGGILAGAAAAESSVYGLIFAEKMQ